jgi:hypothetical protein
MKTIDSGEEPWNVIRLDGFEHEPGKANAEMEARTLDRVDHQSTYIEFLVAREVEKGAADIYLMPRDQPFIDNPWADCLSSATMYSERDLDVFYACQRAEKVLEDWEERWY